MQQNNQTHSIIIPQNFQRIMMVRNHIAASQLSLSRKWISNTEKLIHLLGKYSHTTKFIQHP